MLRDMASYTFLVAGFTFIASTAVAQSIQGSATYRERMALPPTSGFEAVLIAFTISDDQAKIVANRLSAGTSWQLVRFQGSDDRTLTPDDRTKYTIQFSAGHGRVRSDTPQVNESIVSRLCQQSIAWT